MRRLRNAHVEEMGPLRNVGGHNDLGLDGVRKHRPRLLRIPSGAEQPVITGIRTEHRSAPLILGIVENIRLYQLLTGRKHILHSKEIFGSLRAEPTRDNEPTAGISVITVPGALLSIGRRAVPHNLMRDTAVADEPCGHVKMHTGVMIIKGQNIVLTQELIPLGAPLVCIHCHIVIGIRILEEMREFDAHHLHEIQIEFQVIKSDAIVFCHLKGFHEVIKRRRGSRDQVAALEATIRKILDAYARLDVRDFALNVNIIDLIEPSDGHEEVTARILNHKRIVLKHGPMFAIEDVPQKLPAGLRGDLILALVAGAADAFEVPIHGLSVGRCGDGDNFDACFRELHLLFLLVILQHHEYKGSYNLTHVNRLILYQVEDMLIRLQIVHKHVQEGVNAHENPKAEIDVEIIVPRKR